jgi:crotonobetainyl-CoA:carnitine CoA-transferase CaiB-like acyl-CoA transferase
VLVESWRPGVADGLGLGWDDLHAAHPGLVYCSISGFGESGPHRDLPAYEARVHALVGRGARSNRGLPTGRAGVQPRRWARLDTGRSRPRCSVNLGTVWVEK